MISWGTASIEEFDWHLIKPDINIFCDEILLSIQSLCPSAAISKYFRNDFESNLKYQPDI